jgi:peptidoglycan hydrolase CwlO-like protein
MKIIGYKKLKEKVELELFRYKEEEILKINKEILKYQKEQQNEIEHTLKECFDKKLKLQIEIVKLEERQNLLNVNLTQKEKHYEQLIQLKNEEIIRLSELIKDINKNLVNVYCK